VTLLWAGQFGVRIPAGESDFPLPKSPTQVCSPPSLLFNCYQWFFPWGYSRWGMKLITLIPVPWFGTSGDICLLLLHVFIMCTGTALHFLLLYEELYNCTFKAHCLNIPVATHYSGIKVFNGLPKAINLLAPELFF
jgi:hypothetical protein